ncbi:MAG: ORF6N domain-containing protein [Bacteroidota bacterium]
MGLTKEEFDDWRSHFATSNSEKMGLRIPPFAFTEYGVLMLASVLNSELAILVNIQIIKVFTRMKEMLQSNKEIFHQIEQIILKINDHGEKISLLFDYLRQLEKNREEELKYRNRRPLGYKPYKNP